MDGGLFPGQRFLSVWDTGLEPEASAPKNLWLKVKIFGAFTEYGEVPFANNDTPVLAEGWIRAYGPDGRYQLSYSLKGC